MKNKLNGKRKVIVLCCVTLLVILGVSYLNYNQVNRSGLSFEMIYEYVHFQQVGRQFAKGNIDPLLENLAIPGGDNEYAAYAKEAYGAKEEDYVKDTKKHIKEQYQKLFKGKTLKLKKVIAEYNDTGYYYFSQPTYLGVYMIYEVEGIEYVIRLTRNTGNKFYVTDGFIEDSGEVTYVAEESTDNTVEEETGSVEEKSESISELLNHRESIFRCTQPFEDSSFFMMKKFIRELYKQYQAGERDSEILHIFSNDFVKEENLNGSQETVQAYSEQIHTRLQQIVNAGYYCSDIDFVLEGYDKEKHMYQYQVTYTFSYGKEEKKCYLSVECYRNQSFYQNYMILKPETIELIGEEIPSDVQKMMLGMWD